MESESFLVAVIVQSAVYLNFAITEENDVANWSLVLKNMITCEVSPFYLSAFPAWPYASSNLTLSTATLPWPMSAPDRFC